MDIDRSVNSAYSDAIEGSFASWPPTGRSESITGMRAPLFKVALTPYKVYES
jgi:hypothetical protein